MVLGCLRYKIRKVEAKGKGGRFADLHCSEGLAKKNVIGHFQDLITDYLPIYFSVSSSTSDVYLQQGLTE